MKNNRFRIAAMGDSITFGSRLPVSAVYPEQLEDLLQARFPSLDAEVLNFGVTGFDVLNNVEHLRMRALPFRPDVVVMGFCVNDIGTSSTALEYVRASSYLSNPIFRLRLSQFLLSSTLTLVAARQSDNANDLEAFQEVNRARILPIESDAALLAQIDRIAKIPDEAAVGQWWAERPRIGFLEHAFTRLRDLKREHGFEVIVIAFPRLQSRNKERWRLVHEVIRHESLKFGFHFVDVFDDYEKAGLAQLRNEPQDTVHPNADGHAIAARALFDHLVESKLLPAAP
jgi:lysophospholipase L1-like esterase